MSTLTAALPQRKLDQAADILHALAHPLRIQIVDFMTETHEATVVDMQSSLGLEPGLLSNHLRILRQAGIVETSRSGKYISYQLDARRLEDIRRSVAVFGAQVEEVTA